MSDHAGLFVADTTGLSINKLTVTDTDLARHAQTAALAGQVTFHPLHDHAARHHVHIGLSHLKLGSFNDLATSLCQQLVQGGTALAVGKLAQAAGAGDVCASLLGTAAGANVDPQAPSGLSTGAEIAYSRNGRHLDVLGISVNPDRLQQEAQTIQQGWDQLWPAYQEGHLSTESEETDIDKSNIDKQQKIFSAIFLLNEMNQEGLISQDLSTVQTLLSSYTWDALDVLVDQLSILKHVLRDQGSLDSMALWDPEDESVLAYPGNAVITQVGVVDSFVKGALIYGLQKAKPAVEFGLKAGKSILQKVDQIYKKQLIKRFIKKDWQNELNIPQGWNKTMSKNDKGIRYRLPGEKSKDYHEIRVMEGQPGSDFLGQQVDYVKLNRKGQFYDINGGIVDGASQEAHIPINGNEKVIENLIKKIWG